MAGVLIERETVDKNELEALLENRWDEFLKAEAERKATAGESDDEPDEGGSAESDGASTEPKGESVPEPPVAPGTPPPVFNA